VKLTYTCWTIQYLVSDIEAPVLCLCLTYAPALDDHTQEFIWKHLIEGFLHHATVIIASSRPVISCTGILHLSTDGPRGELQMVSGFLPGTHVADMPLPRYTSKTTMNSLVGLSDVSHQVVASQPSRFNSIGSTLEDASVCDVSAAVREFEQWSARSEKASKSDAVEMSASLRKGLLLSTSTRHVSFLQHLLEHADCESVRNESSYGNQNRLLRSQRASYSTRMTDYERSGTIGHNCATDRDLPEADVKDKSVIDVGDEKMISASTIGFVQWMTSMNLGKSVYLIPLSYVMYQAGRTYYFATMLWWSNMFFGFSGDAFILIICIIFCIMTIGRISNDVLVYQSAINGAHRMRKNFCDCIMNAPMTFFMTENLGPLVDVFSGDMSTVSEVLIDCFHYAILYTLLVLGSMFFASSGFPWLVLISAALLAGCAYLQVLYRGRLQKVSLEFQKANNDVFHSISDAIEGLKVLRTANGTQWALDDLTNVLQVARIAVVTSEKCTIWLNTRSCSLGLVVVFAMVFIAHFAIEDPDQKRIITNQTSLYLVFLQWAMKAVGLGIYHLGSVERIHSYLHRIPREARDGHSLDKAWPRQGDIEMKNVCLRYGPSMPLALDDVSFKLQPASKVGVVGRTGSGKSTLLVALFRLINPCSGDMVVGGSSITCANLDSLRARMCIVPQV
jgi:ABC-type multidrug transport system fused ATPase/permease subunit